MRARVRVGRRECSRPRRGRHRAPPGLQPAEHKHRLLAGLRHTDRRPLPLARRRPQWHLRRHTNGENLSLLQLFSSTTYMVGREFDPRAV